MKKIIYLFAIMFAMCSCSKEDEIFGIIDDNSTCYIDYYMNNYYNEYRYNGKSILDRRDIKKFYITKYKDFDGKYCILLIVEYYEKRINGGGYSSTALNSLGLQMYREYKSDDYIHFACGSTCSDFQILCKHPHCLDKYSKYNSVQ